MWKRVGFLPLCACFLLAPCCGQTKADSISGTAPKFLICNQKGQILLVFDQDRQAWEVPGTPDAGPITFQNLLADLTKEYGLRYQQSKLGGLFTYPYSTRYKTIIRPYFTVLSTGFIDGKNFSKRACPQWFDPEKIKQVVVCNASIMIVDKLVKEPKTVWAGAFEE